MTKGVNLKSANGVVVPLDSLLSYKPQTGKLTWLHRPSPLFPSKRDWKVWNVRFAGAEAFTSFNGSGYLNGRIFGRGYRAHRVIWALVYGEWPDQIDHINGNRSDNRLANLRSVSRAENNRNTSRKSNNTSGHNGVCWSATAGKWQASITVGGQSCYLGLFPDIESAVQARAEANRLHGYHVNHGRPSRREMFEARWPDVLP